MKVEMAALRPFRPRSADGTHPTRLDLLAAFVPGDAVSAVGAYGVESLEGVTGTGGFVTRFGFTPIPEPSVVALLGIGLVALLLSRFHNSNHKPTTRKE